ncbi:MAG: hypothetical protein GVY06_08965 [Alphaproteobacteria bacterium]|jgi:uncharacterized protein YkwD|nr:hypothetical protein [Alphaproteobacteria bacterium]
MLQFYDKHWSISVLAFAALATPITASADSAEPVPASACELDDGYAGDLAGFVAEANACLDQRAESGLEAKAEDVHRLTQRMREKNALAPQIRHVSLDAAAQMHALDMAARGYAAHEDLEGRGHEDRIRAMGRQLVFGASGANITVIEADGSAPDIYNALIADETSRNNLFRDAFTHTGFGLAQGNGRLYAVQVFSRVDGELAAPLPVDLPAMTPIPVEFADPAFRLEGWRIEDSEGRQLARGLAPRLYRARLAGQAGHLTLEARRGTAVYSLKGPSVSAQ